jgi:hypothetical protein
LRLRSGVSLGDLGSFEGTRRIEDGVRARRIGGTKRFGVP